MSFRMLIEGTKDPAIFSSDLLISFSYNNGKGIEHWNDVIVK